MSGIERPTFTPLLIAEGLEITGSMGTHDGECAEYLPWIRIDAGVFMATPSVTHDTPRRLRLLADELDGALAVHDARKGAS